MERMKAKIDHILWAAVWMLPVFGYLVAFWRIGSAPPIFEYINANFSFTWVKNILDTILNAAFETNFAITGYISYLVGVEILHTLFDVIVFIPRFAHELIDWGTHLGREKKHR